jgi:hypothetical protein
MEEVNFRKFPVAAESVRESGVGESSQEAYRVIIVYFVPAIHVLLEVRV